MAEVFVLKGPGATALNAAEKALSEGELVVLPTDTVYGVAARPDLPSATGRVFDVKRRSRDLTLPILAAEIDEAEGIGLFDARARLLAERFWPGGLTIVLPRTLRARGWDLGEEWETVGIRIPDHAVALSLLARAGPLAVTSANRSGEPTPSTCDGVQASLGDLVSVYLCAGPAFGEVPSTVIDLTGSEPRILREGAVPSEALVDTLDRTP